MGRMAELGPTRETESGEETLRVAAVEVAWRLIRRHPNWHRNYGFSVGEAWMPQFVDSMQGLKATVEAQVERQLERGFATGRRPALPDTVDAILTAVFLLRSGRRPVRPIPSGIGATWRALLPFCGLESGLLQTSAMSSAPERVTSIVDGEGWYLNLEAWRRPVSVH